MSQPPEPSRRGQPLLRRADQAALAGLTLLALGGVAGWVLSLAWGPAGLVDFDAATPLSYAHTVDVNRAEWPELAALPEIGETLARRIVARRAAAGPYRSLEDLRRVRGVGPRTLDRIRRYLSPLPEGGAVAGR